MRIYSFYEWLTRVRKYYAFGRAEQLWLAISVVVLTFIVGFNDGNDEFQLFAYVKNMLLSFTAIAVAVFVHESAHRIFALNMGYKVEFKPVLYGLIAGIILAFMSNGKIILLAYSSTFVHFIEKLRLGYFRYRMGHFDLGKICLMGPLANLAVAIAVKTMGFLPEPLAEKLLLVNVLFAITNMLPIPPLDGVSIMWASKTFYPLALVSVVGCAALLLLPQIGVWIAVTASLVIGIFAAFAYFNFLEPKLGPNI